MTEKLPIRGRPFSEGASGNPRGRPRGSRNRATIAAEILLDGEAEALTRKAVELALEGDLNALRLCMDRVLPSKRELTIQFEIKKLASIDDAQSAMSDIITAVARGEITISEAAELAKLVEMFIRMCEVSERSAWAIERARIDAEDRRDEKDRRRRMGIF